LTSQAEVWGEKIRFQDGKVSFMVKRDGETLGEVEIAPPGRHNVYNALAAICVGLELEIPFQIIAGALKTFEGVQRRMQVKGQGQGVTVVDDYGHHPTEIVATLSAIKEAWPDKRLVVMFQPHRYSRTQGLFSEFLTAFHLADFLVMTEIYAASEKPITGISGESLLEAIKRHGQRRTLFLPEVDRMAKDLLPHLQEGDLVLSLGAGNIVRVGEEIVELLKKTT
jgi:UDP-N-acetylmuramate--alanine ligase